MIVSLIAAYALDKHYRKVIGKDNKIPWSSKTDLRRFREYTSKHAIIMGRKTFESIGRVLPDRHNVILSSQKNYKISGAEVFGSLEDAVKFSSSLSPEIFIIGGENVYKQALPKADRLYLTKIETSSYVDGDAFFPFFDRNDFSEIHKETLDTETFSIFQRKIITSKRCEGFDVPSNNSYSLEDTQYWENI